jgi:hypothetical protein
VTARHATTDQPLGRHTAEGDRNTAKVKGQAAMPVAGFSIAIYYAWVLLVEILR